jgi:hypothetical protein
MRSYVVIATKGRPHEVRLALDFLKRQTRPPDFTVVVGTAEIDIAEVREHSLLRSRNGAALISPRIGLTSQRNYVLENLTAWGLLDSGNGGSFCAFLDDDFLVAPDWLEVVERRFEKGDIVGLDGLVLADGSKIDGLTAQKAEIIIDSARTSGGSEREAGVLYGCNMAFIDKVIVQNRFDENLPLIGWMDDAEYSHDAKRMGKLIHFPEAKGVHLAVQSRGGARGVKFGYAQIANPIYFARRRVMSTQNAVRIIALGLASNTVHSLSKRAKIDYAGRLIGNLYALADLITFRSDPMRVVRL